MARDSVDHWSSDKYSSAASFVPKLTTKVLSYLDVQPNDRILDIGCGDGVLTSQIAHAASSGQVLGLDASTSFIETAQQKYATSNCTFKKQDCTKLDQCPEAVDGSWDKVFSNAAMHWILRKPEIRQSFFQNVNKALKPGGKFVFEMGGNGNVAEVQAAATAALLHAGVGLKSAHEANPWFFPSEAYGSMLLKEAGFDVEICEHEYRSTKLTADTDDKSGGLEGWVKLMCAPFLECVTVDKRDEVTREICDIIDPIITRHEDGSKWMGYCRLRAVARKK
jgi:trans-aconitate methyltransferase